MEDEQAAPPDAAASPPLGRAMAREGASFERVSALADGCRACELWARATQTVFGSGPTPAAVMLVGEQPGDREDVVGEPFVGPAGQLLDRALGEAGIDREQVFVTNVVKHFKWRPSGKRRLHERPDRAEVRACYPWFEAELALARPLAIVCLGATAAAAILGPQVRVTASALRLIATPLAPVAVATLHPSAVLRMSDVAAREQAFDRLVGDLRLTAREVAAIERARAPT
jgi:DNA polymerase